METTTLLALALSLLLGVVLGALVTLVWTRSPGRGGPAEAVAAALAESERRSAAEGALREGLERLHQQMRDLEHQRSAWQGQWHEQVAEIRRGHELLRQETHSLATALRRPQVRGRWGEMHLRKAVETAGMVEHCDFIEQARLADGELRPDLVVRLAGGRQIAVDAKVPLDAFLDLTGAEDPDEQAAHLARHVRQFRTHIDQLSSRRYWRALSSSPEFVVLFVPGESFLSAALEGEARLIEYAAERQVVLATPTTLIALLRTVAHGWRHEVLTEQAQAVHVLGRELHARLGVLTRHVDRVGRALDSAVTSYNQAVGSLEGRVLVSARRFVELGVTDDDLESPRQVETAARRAADVVSDPPTTVWS